MSCIKDKTKNKTNMMKTTASSEYIRSPMNYVGGKYKLLQYIIPNFPKQINNFVDLFCGGLNIGINVEANTIYANDQIVYLIELYKLFQKTSIESLLETINERINYYNLSKTNKDGYIALRNEYNKSKSPIDLFVLTCYSFNNNIRFNNKHEFNAAFGENRSSFNDSIQYNLISFCNALHNKNIILSSGDFRDFDTTSIAKDDVVYCDPPYLISTCTYNDGNRGFKNWTKKEKIDLLSLLDDLNKRGILFALSNVLEHKGQENDILIEWSKKYNVAYIDKNYSNCIYNLIKREGTKTVEVLITNYKY